MFGYFKYVTIGTLDWDMDGLTTTADRFSFAATELPQQLIANIQASAVGYWEHQFSPIVDGTDRSKPLCWNLGVVNGLIVYSGTRLWSGQSLIRVVERYALNTRHPSVKPRFDLLKSEVEQRQLTPIQICTAMRKANICDDSQLLQAIQTKILNDLDTCLSMGGGSAKFVSNPELADLVPIAGFDPVTLMELAVGRMKRWDELKAQIPSMNLVPILNPAMMVKTKISASQQKRIENLVKSGDSLHEIAVGMSKDNLEIAEIFAKLVRVGLVNLAQPSPAEKLTIMAIDDSPVMLKQFQKMVLALGYSVAVCAEADRAIAQILSTKPAAIFIDLNMPGISGFDLVKQIRQQPLLAEIPLAILTGEHKLSNRWRAQWTGCEFITKPLTASAVKDFQIQLEELIPKLLNTPSTLSSEHSNN